MVSRQEQSLRAATAARSAALRVMPMKVEQRDWEVGSEGGGGGRDNGEGSSRSDGVAVRAWLTPRFRRREWSSGRSHRSKLGAGWRGMICFSGPSRPTHLPQRNHMRPRAHRCWCHAVARASRLGACLQAACRAMRTACGAACSTCKHPWPSCPRAKGLGRDGLGSQTSTELRQNGEGASIFFEGLLLSFRRAFQRRVNRFKTPTGRLNQHFLGDPPPPDPDFSLIHNTP